MTKDPKTVTPDATLKDVVAMMQEHKFGAVPIVEGDNKLVGIVTSNDMLVLLRTLLEQS
jgi:CBS domain-containing protein